MIKLSSNTFENVKISKIRKFLKENNDINGLKEYIREEIYNILDEKGELEKSDFEMIINDFENKVGFYREFAIKNGLQGLPVFIISKIIRLLGNDKKIGNKHLKNILLDSNKSILNKLLELLLKIDDDSLDYNHFFAKNKTRKLLNGDEKNLDFIIETFGLEKSDNLFNFIFNNQVLKVITKGNNNILVNLVKSFSIKTKDEFINLIGPNESRNILYSGNSKNVEKVIEHFGIKTLESLKRFIVNINIKKVIIDSNESNLSIILDRLGINKQNDFNDFVSSNRVRSVLKNGKEDNLITLLNIFNINTISGFKNVLSNSKAEEILIKGNEYIFRKILFFLKDNLDIIFKEMNLINIIIKGEEKNLELLINSFGGRDDGISWSVFVQHYRVKGVIVDGNFKSIFKIIELFGINSKAGFIRIIEESEFLLFSKYDFHDNVFYFLENIDDVNLRKNVILNINHSDLNKLGDLDENIVNRNIDSKYIEYAISSSEIFYEFIKTYLENKGNIDNHKNGAEFGLFSYLVKAEFYDKLIDYPINKDNFLDYMYDKEQLIDFDEGKNIDWDGIKPWTKSWFLERPKRKEFLKTDYVKTFNKFGNIIAIGIIEGITDSNKLNIYYEKIFKSISLENNRGSILQLGEVFNLVLKNENYYMLNELSEGENIGDDFKEFIDNYSISDKGKTIITLMISREIRDSFAIFKNKKGEQEIDYLSVQKMLKKVHYKLLLYKKEIEKFNNIPIKTSIGLEYEVTEGIAKGYEEITGRNYKKDIVIISEYAGVARGNDAVHEIATKPIDNPMLLILEMKLLEDLDFVDLNFKKDDYERGSRGLHITKGGEYGFKLDKRAQFIQNILALGNIGGLNAGARIERVNRYSTIRPKKFKSVFGNKRDIACTEDRSTSIDKKEQFERLIISEFTLSMAKQAIDKFLLKDNDSLRNYNLDSIDKFIEDIYIHNKELIKLEDKRILHLMYLFLKLEEDISLIVKNHNKNFLKNEILDENSFENIAKLFSLMTSTGPVVQIMKQVGVDIHYFKSLGEYNFLNQNEFEQRLKKDAKNLEKLTSRQRKILFKEYNLKIKKELINLRQNFKSIYNNLGDYLNGSIEETTRKITNSKRFKEVTIGDSSYLKSLIVNNKFLYQELNPELVNIFTKINNLFIKEDSVNALAMYDNTIESDGSLVSDRRLAETTIFDKIELGLKPRNGYNVIQGASENMIVQAMQKRILKFNEKILELINS